MYIHVTSITSGISLHKNNDLIVECTDDNSSLKCNVPITGCPFNIIKRLDLSAVSFSLHRNCKLLTSMSFFVLCNTMLTH